MEKYRKKIVFGLILLCGASWIVWMFFSEQTSPENGVYLARIVQIFGFLFVTVLFMINSDNDTFEKWLQFTAVYFLLYFSGMIFVFKKTNSVYQFEDYVNWLCWAYLIISLAFFIYDLITEKKKNITNKSIELKKAKRSYYILIGGGTTIFLSGLVSRGFWFYGTIYFGIPILLYCGSIFFRYSESLGHRKFLMEGLLTVLTCAILFMFYALAQMF